MIKVEQDEQHNYIVQFQGKQSDFSHYINSIMAVQEKWKIKGKHGWVLNEIGYKKLCYLLGDEMVESIGSRQFTPTKTVSDYGNIGKGMKLQPYDYQKESIKFGLEAQNCLMVLPCGSGKTPIGIGLYLEARNRKMIKGPGIVVVKASLKKQWIKEIEKFSDLKATIIETEADATASAKDRIKRRERKLTRLRKHPQANAGEIATLEKEIASIEVEARDKFKNQFKGYDLFVLNYETLKDSWVRSELHRLKAQFIYADEIHYVKSHTADRSKVLYEFADAKLKYGATATPVSKNPMDVFGIYKFLVPTLFPRVSKFQGDFCKFAGRGRIVGGKNLNFLNKQIAPYMIIKTKEEVAKQLPSLVVMQRYCDMSPAQVEMTERLMAELDELKEQEFAIRSKMKSDHEAENNPQLKQIDANILARQTFAQELADSEKLLAMSDSDLSKEYMTGSKEDPKLELLIDLLEEIIDSDEKVCVFSKYEKMQGVITERIKKHKDLKKFKIAYVNGKMNANQRYTEVYDKFRDNDEYKILLCSDAGAEGLNLSKCKYLIEYEPADSYGVQIQRHGRVERADSIHDNVFVYQLICNDSWDEIGQKIIAKKEGYDAEIIKGAASMY